LASGYEKALIALYEQGMKMPTQYDKPGDPPSIDSTMNITYLNPEKDPMIHKAFPGGIEDLREYVMELLGYKDHWVKNMDDPNDTKWEYTYHGRLANWGRWREIRRAYSQSTGKSKEAGEYAINQIKIVVDKLCKQPFTRQAQMITWMPFMDNTCYDPPCLQRLHYRLLKEDDKQYWLNCNISFRSNDAWGAHFMNVFGFTHFNRILIANEIEKNLGVKVGMGRINWQADSFHIYGKDIQQFKERFYDRLGKTSFSDRYLNFYDEEIQAMYNEATEMVIKKIADVDKDMK
jgi:thymidylate synthase